MTELKHVALYARVSATRVEAEMARAKVPWKHIARPALPVALQARIRDLRRQGLSMNQMGR